MQQRLRGSQQGGSSRLRRQSLSSRAQEIERMLEVGAFDTKIRQRESELQAMRAKKASLESELDRLRRALDDLVDA